MPNRPHVPDNQIQAAVSKFKEELKRRLDEKGYGTFASRHEIYGVLMEEVLEFEEAARSSSSEELVSELYDIAVAAIFGAACIEGGYVDW